jgi:hypothetical protein
LLPVVCYTSHYQRHRTKGSHLMQQPTSSSSLLYRSLANAIDTAKGTILLDLNQGNWNTNLFGQEILWIVPLGCEAEIEFDYGGGFLNSASITFDPPVSRDVRVTQRRIVLVVLDADGLVEEPWRHRPFDHPFLNRFRPRTGLFVGEQRHRRYLAGLMAPSAIRVQNLRDLLREGGSLQRSRIVGCL